MKALLIVAHGSRRPASNDEIKYLASDVANLAGKKFDLVSHAFIQFTTPLLSDEIDALVNQGATDIIIFPYFIASGSHVVQDIPEGVQGAREKHPGIAVTILPHLGQSRGIKQLILDEVNR
ncbi:MAG: CbiX/SirB N-terminal domain-containing protein [Pseudomonadota bacterium]